MAREQEALAAAFQTLLQQAGISGKAELRRSRPPSGLGLFASSDLLEQEAVLKVPVNRCIVEPRELPADVAAAAGGVPDSFTWDVRLAVKLREASLGRWDAFWGEYGKLFPKPQHMAQPSLLPRNLLLELHHTAALVAAQAQQQRLRSLFPDLVPAEDAPPEAYPSHLQWTFALARSRSFAAGEDHFAIVPFIDLANSDPVPNVDVQFVREERCFYLRTTRRVAKGGELLLPLEPLDNQRLFARFGWVEPGGNPHDRLPGIAGAPDAPTDLRLSRKRLWECLKAQSFNPDDIFSMSPYARATLQSLPLAEEGSASSVAELQAVRQLRASLQDVQTADFRTPVEADIQRAQAMKAGAGVPDPRLLALLLYRVERKTLIATALSLLASYEAYLQQSDRALT